MAPNRPEPKLPAAASVQAAGPWWKILNRYHWFVLTVAALGWLFDTMDQQLFNLARVPAMKALLKPGEEVALYGGYATSIFLIGWATGGLTFGVLGDRIGRVKTMIWTILIYSICTGLSALSVGFWDFAFYRFITGLGVGGEFAVGVSLVAEVMPDSARPYALGLLQALSAVGNITAALMSMGLGHLEEMGVIGGAWRWMFVIGAAPALLAILVMRRLQEPERWQAARRTTTRFHLGSYGDLFGNERWRRPAAVAGLFVVAIIAVAFFGSANWPKFTKLKIGVALALCALAVPSFGQTETVLYTFQAGTDAALPYAGLVHDSIGNLYGTTLWGGTYNDGAVFKLDRGGHERVVYSFVGGNDGIAPAASLFLDKGGNLYGTTTRGGSSADAGIVFKIKP